MNYGIREGYTPNLTPKYFIDDQYDGKHWQPDALPIAAHLARAMGRKELVDIGCGRGEKLVKYADEFAITGIDYGVNIEYARKHHSVGVWVNHDIENGFYPYLERSQDKVFICADTIEHLVNPDPLVTSIRLALLMGGYVVLTTPDRERNYGARHLGQPENPSHVREWTLAELRNWLASKWTLPILQGWTLNNDVERKHNTILMILGYPTTAVDNLETLFDLERAV